MVPQLAGSKLLASSAGGSDDSASGGIGRSQAPTAKASNNRVGRNRIMGNPFASVGRVKVYYIPALGGKSELAASLCSQASNSSRDSFSNTSISACNASNRRAAFQLRR